MDSDQIKEVLEDLGYKLSDRGAYWQTNAIFRNGDNTTAIQIYKDTGVWKDYVKDTRFSPFKKLIQATLGSNDPQEIAKYFKNDKIEELYAKRSAPQKIQLEEVHDESCLERLLPHHKFYNKKGVDSNILKSLKGGLATSGQLNQRYVFPIYNEHKQIHGFSGRDILAKSNRPKWKHIGRKSNWIYPLHVNTEARESILREDEVLLVESIGDLLKCHQFGIKNVLVSFGLSISPKLMCALLELSPKKIVIAFNNDSDKSKNRGLEAAIKNYLKCLTHFHPERLMLCLPIKNDFGDMGAEDFPEWKEKKKTICLEPAAQREFLLEKITEMAKNKELSNQLLKNKKILLNLIDE